MAINQNLQQSMGSVPFYAQQQGAAQPQQAPINFAGGEQAEAPKKSGGISIGKLLLGTAIAVGAVGAHKTSALSKEFKALKEVEGSTIAKTSEYKFRSNFLHNCNPLNWFGNTKTAEALAAEGSGFKKVGESKKFIQNEAGDILQISGKNVRKLDGTKTDEANAFLNKVKEAEAKAAETTTEAKAETTTEAKNKSQNFEEQAVNPDEPQSLEEMQEVINKPAKVGEGTNTTKQVKEQLSKKNNISAETIDKNLGINQPAKSAGESAEVFNKAAKEGNQTIQTISEKFTNCKNEIDKLASEGKQLLKNNGHNITDPQYLKIEANLKNEQNRFAKLKKGIDPDTKGKK